MTQKSGPLRGVKVVEIAGIGPGPMCGMMLADMGAEVILVERKSKNPNAPMLPRLTQKTPKLFSSGGNVQLSWILKNPKPFRRFWIL